jgi:hypothetical protein
MVGLTGVGEPLVITALIAGTPFISLHTADPGNTGASEVAGSSYARVALGTNSNAGNNPTVMSNTAIITFPTATGSWGTITHFGLWDAVTAGNNRGSGALTTAKAVNNGDTARFAIGALTITVN